MSALDVLDAQPEHAEAVLGVIRRAFAVRPTLDPPSKAMQESAGSVRAALSDAGGLLVLRRGSPVGAMLFDRSRPGLLGLRRVSVDPAHQGHGVASAMVGVAEDVAESDEYDGIWLTAREELPETLSFWQRRGYLRIGADSPSVRLGKTLWVARTLPTAQDTQRLGARLARLLRAGDLLVLAGGLGAGKTTMAQGLGAGLGVRGPVTSPTYVISRVHPSLVDGPPLVHVDAYRLGGAAELDDLDLKSSLEESVTVVEWGSGLVEGLSDNWLELRLGPLDDGTSAGPAALAAAGPWRNRVPSPSELSPGEDTRVVSVRPHGPRWLEVPLRSTVLAP